MPFSVELGKFRLYMSEFYSKFLAATGEAKSNTEVYTAMIDKPGNIISGITTVYGIGWVVNTLADQSRSMQIISNSQNFKSDDYYEILKFAKVVFLFSPKIDYVSRDKCEPYALQHFFGGTLEEFTKYVELLKTYQSGGPSYAPAKSVCDCGMRVTAGLADDQPGHSSWCKTREIYGKH